MTDLVKLFAEMDSMGVEELMRQSWQRSFGIMRLLRGEGKFCDVTLHCEGLPGSVGGADSPALGLVAHKVVLVSWSGYFRNLMDVGLFEEVEVMVPGVSHLALAWLLDLMYGETEPAVNDENVDTIFQAAMILQVPLAVSLCAQLMKQRRRGGGLIGDIVSSTIPEVDADPPPPISALSPSRGPQRVASSSENHFAPSSTLGMPILQRAVKVEPTTDCQPTTSTMNEFRRKPEQRRDERACGERSDEVRFRRISESEDTHAESGFSLKSRGSPFGGGGVEGTSSHATSPRRQIISATRTPIFKPKARNGPRPIAVKSNQNPEYFRQQSPVNSTVNGNGHPDRFDSPQQQHQLTTQHPTLFVPMPTLTQTTIPSSGVNLHSGLLGNSGLSMSGMAALGALQLGPILVPTSSTSPMPSTSPEGDGEEGRLVIHEDEEMTEDKSGNKRLRKSLGRSKRQKLSSGMELVPVAEEGMDAALVPVSSKNNLTIVAICNICQKGFTSKTGYKKHVRTHMGAFPYHCPVCNKGYFDHYTLQEHLNAHKGLKVHGCTRCGKKYQRKKNLVIHQRTCMGIGRVCEPGELPPDFSPPESEVRLLSDGPWSENGESLADDEDIGGSEGGGGSGGLVVAGTGLMKEEDGGLMLAESGGAGGLGGGGLILLSPKREGLAGNPFILPKGVKLVPSQDANLPGSGGGVPSDFPPAVGLKFLSTSVASSSSSASERKPFNGSAFEGGASPPARTTAPTSRGGGGVGSDDSIFPDSSPTTPSPTVCSTTMTTTTTRCSPPPMTSSSHVEGAAVSSAAGSSPNGKQKFQCPHCPEIVAGRRSLQDHLAKSHAQPEKFTCPTCGRVFKYMTSLAHHLETVRCGAGAAEDSAPVEPTPMTSTPKPQRPASPLRAKSPVASPSRAKSPVTSPLRAKSPVTSPLTPSRKSKRISKRNSGGGPGAVGSHVEEGGSGGGGKVLHMGGVEGSSVKDGGGGFVILNEDET